MSKDLFYQNALDVKDKEIRELKEKIKKQESIIEKSSDMIKNFQIFNP